jgi:hypothetical protein
MKSNNNLPLDLNPVSIEDFPEHPDSLSAARIFYDLKACALLIVPLPLGQICTISPPTTRNGPHNVAMNSDQAAVWQLRFGSLLFTDNIRKPFNPSEVVLRDARDPWPLHVMLEEKGHMEFKYLETLGRSARPKDFEAHVSKACVGILNADELVTGACNSAHIYLGFSDTGVPFGLICPWVKRLMEGTNNQELMPLLRPLQHLFPFIPETSVSIVRHRIVSCVASAAMCPTYWIFPHWNCYEPLLVHSKGCIRIFHVNEDDDAFVAELASTYTLEEIVRVLNEAKVDSSLLISSFKPLDDSDPSLANEVARYILEIRISLRKELYGTFFLSPTIEISEDANLSQKPFFEASQVGAPLFNPSRSLSCNMDPSAMWLRTRKSYESPAISALLTRSHQCVLVSRSDVTDKFHHILSGRLRPDLHLTAKSSADTLCLSSLFDGWKRDSLFIVQLDQDHLTILCDFLLKHENQLSSNQSHLLIFFVPFSGLFRRSDGSPMLIAQARNFSQKVQLIAPNLELIDLWLACDSLLASADDFSLQVPSLTPIQLDPVFELVPSRTALIEKANPRLLEQKFRNWATEGASVETYWPLYASNWITSRDVERDIDERLTKALDSRDQMPRFSCISVRCDRFGCGLTTCFKRLAAGWSQPDRRIAVYWVSSDVSPSQFGQALSSIRQQASSSDAVVFFFDFEFNTAAFADHRRDDDLAGPLIVILSKTFWTNATFTLEPYLNSSSERERVIESFKRGFPESVPALEKARLMAEDRVLSKDGKPKDTGTFSSIPEALKRVTSDSELADRHVFIFAFAAITKTFTSARKLVQDLLPRMIDSEPNVFKVTAFLSAFIPHQRLFENAKQLRSFLHPEFVMRDSSVAPFESMEPSFAVHPRFNVFYVVHEVFARLVIENLFRIDATKSAPVVNCVLWEQFNAALLDPSRYRNDQEERYLAETLLIENGTGGQRAGWFLRRLGCILAETDEGRRWLVEENYPVAKVKHLQDTINESFLGKFIDQWHLRIKWTRILRHVATRNLAAHPAAAEAIIRYALECAEELHTDLSEQHDDYLAKNNIGTTHAVLCRVLTGRYRQLQALQTAQKTQEARNEIFQEADAAFSTLNETLRGSQTILSDSHVRGPLRAMWNELSRSNLPGLSEQRWYAVLSTAFGLRHNETIFWFSLIKCLYSCRPEPSRRRCR